ncbi:MAG TPA: hypothetical protein VN541_16610 [Tepidisphaeraceae bacterium]|nr:hypothetical protein [Tepidisphaeraceae bacterium]
MKLLLDHNLPKRIRASLSGHIAMTTRQMGWEKLGNGALLKMAASANFDAFLSIDKNIRHQQNLATLPLPVVVLDSSSNALPDSLLFVPGLLAVLGGTLDRAVYVIARDGQVIRFST